jgi:uncharacterized tellurite resistance protein B-like protein
MPVLTRLLDKLTELLPSAPAAPDDTVSGPFARRDVAVVALLIEAAQIDRTQDAAESTALERIVRARFGLDAAGTAQLIETAHTLLAASLEDWIFAAAVRDGFTVAERVEILGLLWEVVYADGQLARFEQSLLRRLAKQLRLRKADTEMARAQAFARSGRKDADTAGAE